MDRVYLQGVFNYLNDYFAETSKKGIIESQVRSYAKNLDQKLYLILNENNSSDLFEHGFFESDLSRSLKKLKDILEE